MMPAEQPMPPKLYDRMLLRIPKRLTSMALRLGVGQNRLQFTTRMPTSRGFRPVHAGSCRSECSLLCLHTWVCTLAYEDAGDDCIT